MELTARRTGWAAAAVTAVGFFAVSGALGFEPGRPIGDRTDVYFQSDAGGLVADAATGESWRGRGVHPLVYPLWTWPLHRVAALLEPWVSPSQTAAVGSRALVAACAGAGVGVLATVLARRGVRPRTLAAVAPVYVFGTAQTLAAIPDHFGISQGVLAAAFGVFLGDGSFRAKAITLSVLTGLAFGVTVTNALFPGGLLVAVVLNRYRPAWRWYAAAGVVGLAAAGVGGGVLMRSDDVRERFLTRVKLYLNWKLTEDPPGAAKRSVRGLLDSAVGPTPVVSSRNNLERLPMLTYEPVGSPYRLWPYDAVQSVGAVAWVVLLAVGTWRADRPAAVAVWAWVGWNAVLHNVWGDEYFLYTPHYSWALAAVVVIGWRRVSVRWLLPLTVGVAAAAVYSLIRIRAVLDTIPV